MSQLAKLYSFDVLSDKLSIQKQSSCFGVLNNPNGDKAAPVIALAPPNLANSFTLLITRIFTTHL